MDIQCCEKNCQVSGSIMIDKIDDGVNLLAFCLNHEAIWIYSKIKNLPFEHEVLATDDIFIKNHSCEICDKTKEFKRNNFPLYRFTTNNKGDSLQLYLCYGHLARLLKHDLEPDDYSILVKNHGTFYHIRDGFYDPEYGMKLQPMEII